MATYNRYIQFKTALSAGIHNIRLSKDKRTIVVNLNNSPYPKLYPATDYNKSVIASATGVWIR